ncbi:glycerol-3-phosphate cytidylyltransferase [Rheinheimera tangshanensis]|jgi:glycerol-3-phosphate cytidylyltransferase|uniref:Glycerol-3-phosphate cytidylyltransferase n=1 Tax=Rheinheimera tangshanensis TaxID=400153 RepID=A0A5C8LXT4_9GAMM|nr:glycerol-3-phosphate cytidylyltransferase [Rheinheimera tangshanensis]TXK80422.1 glycerol-3-phosphate cytidylyltransferase [Rheinheimera tangshanensis]GGM61424.1 glycerol-3-phosphate cytidylyltransferase [Rheinheimera tangshanensis]
MKTVITYGTFDLFHVGHVNLLKRARELGDRLVVAVSTDEFNLQEKNKTTIVPYEHRVKVLESCRYVDLVIPESSWSQKERDILEYQIDTFVMGDDWEGKFDELKTLCNVVYLPRTKNISSTAIKQAVAVITQLSKELT